MKDIAEISSIHGAFARSDGYIKLPSCSAIMPHGGIRFYETKWIKGIKTKSSKTARHEYLSLLYRGKNYKIHRLICEAFHGKPLSKKAVVIHINENALDNRPANLRWGTQKENMNSAGYIEYCKSRTGESSSVIKGKKRKLDGNA